ncbi:conjugal transfer protein TraG [Roseomonas stagni]|uniref:Conjugal transfer protein TraG n=1 Tax=Falsiroseomonas algicola TaxID=2716930 RepID=A0A6M1LKB7_9PROT|nr:DUF6524 family protein [Falsiroseomonas algicola]NGM20770.1 conjugal transfer protein TraG [Falsiroseomonas algicola]
MSAAPFNWRGVVARALFSLFIVFAVYNPSGTSYLHWVLGGFDWFWAKLAVGAVLTTILLLLWKTTMGVLGRLGVALVMMFSIGASITLAQLTGQTLFDGATLLIWALVSIAAVFTAGLSYSHLDHRLTGITHTEEVKK